MDEILVRRDGFLCKWIKIIYNGMGMGGGGEERICINELEINDICINI